MHEGLKELRVTRYSLLAAFLLLVTFLFLVFLSAQNIKTVLAQEGTTEEQKKQLQEQLAELQKELEKTQAEIDKYAGEAASYERDINILENEIRKIRLKMQRNQLIINEIGFAIQTNAETIEELNEKYENNKQLLAKLLLSIYKLDDTSSLEIFLATQSLSEFFNDVNSVKNLQEGMAGTLEDILAIRESIELESEQLSARLIGQAALLEAQSIQQDNLNQKVDAQEQLLSDSRTKEYQLREVAQQTQKSIQEIRNQIFRLEGAGVAVTFEEAYRYAKFASELTGVRPALLLSILKQESSWGKNVGLCTLYNKDNGDGKGVKTGRIIPRVMKVSRDIEPFFQITQELGRDPYNTRISCWPEIYYQGHPYGYGGAMGPAQFLPSTWMGYKDRLASILAPYNIPPDPWNIRAAFVVSAIKLADAGATAKTYKAERKAALIYYAGGNWSSPVNAFYGNAVMQRAAEYQRDIDILEGN